MSDLKRHCEFIPGYDKRNSDPSKDYGISGGRFMFVVSGDKGAVHFSFLASYYPQSAINHLICHHRNDARSVCESLEPIGADVGYHALEPQYENQYSHDNCEWVGGTCYYDGSALRASEWMENFKSRGTAWLWPELEQEYRDRFE